MHALEQNSNGDTTFVSARVPAWHRLGTVLEADAITAAEALDAAHLGGWEVETMPLITSDHDGNPMVVPNKYATVRRNPFDKAQSDALGIVGSDYEVIQNEQAFEWLNAITDTSGAVFQTAGSILGGSRVFVSMLLPDGITVGGEDPHDLYLTAITSHDGSLALTTIPTPVRVVCQNTATLALSGAQVAHKVRHTSDPQGKVQEAREALGLAFGYADKWSLAMEDLLAESMTDNEFDRLISENFLPVADTAAPGVRTRVLNERDALHSLFTASPTTEFGRGTRYAAFNAITEWSEWLRPRDAFTEASASTTLFGAGRDLRQRAYKTLVTL